MRRSKLKEIDFYLITDSGLSKNGILHDVEMAVEAGCKIVQYREKNKETKPMVEEAIEIKILCDDNALLLINDRIDVALAVDADGVHIGQDDMPIEIARELLGKDKIIGLTVHNVEEAVDAEKKGADYVGLSPIFVTSTKKDAGEACGVPMITEVKKHISIPVVVIGGITGENIEEVMKAGADSAVAISDVITVDDVFAKITELRKIMGA